MSIYDAYISRVGREFVEVWTSSVLVNTWYVNNNHNYADTTVYVCHR